MQKYQKTEYKTGYFSEKMVKKPVSRLENGGKNGEKCVKNEDFSSRVGRIFSGCDFFFAHVMWTFLV